MTLPISVTLSAASYPSTVVSVAFKNQSPSTCYEVANYALMTNNSPRDNFQITNRATNEEAVYTGPAIKRQLFYTPIAPGETKNVEVSLESMYKIPKGQNSVQYIDTISYRECDRISKEYSDAILSNTIDIKV